MKKPKEIIPTESQEQQTLFQWARGAENIYPELRLMFHIPNGGLRNKPVAVRLTSEGVRRGVPDICLPVSRGNFHGLYIELKRQKQWKISEDQERWLIDLAQEGYAAFVCIGWVDARRTIEQYLGGCA